MTKIINEVKAEILKRFEIEITDIGNDEIIFTLPSNPIMKPSNKKISISDVSEYSGYNGNPLISSDENFVETEFSNIRDLLLHHNLYYVVK